MPKNRIKRFNSRGDTIVEVFIAIVIVSFVLMSAYSLSQRSSKSIIDAQEHGQAAKFVESQIEYLRSNNGTHRLSACFDNGTEVTSTVTACTIRPNGPGSSPAYSMTITKSSTHVYSITATWDNVYGTGKAAVNIFYRLVE